MTFSCWKCEAKGAKAKWFILSLSHGHNFRGQSFECAVCESSVVTAKRVEANFSNADGSVICPCDGEMVDVPGTAGLWYQCWDCGCVAPHLAEPTTEELVNQLAHELTSRPQPPATLEWLIEWVRERV